jgi:predicted transporter
LDLLFAAISGLSGIVLGIFLGKVWKEKKQDEKKKNIVFWEKIGFFFFS